MGRLSANELPYGGRTLVVDTSAWVALHKLERASPHHPLAALFDQALRSGQLRGSDMVKIELLHNARGRAALLDAERELDKIRTLPISSQASRAAIGALRTLSERSTAGFPTFHRVGHGDSLVAATAWHAGIDVLHYDEHFDRLGEALGFDSVWVFPRRTFARIDAESATTDF